MVIMSFLSNLSLGLNKKVITGCDLQRYFLGLSRDFDRYWVVLHRFGGKFFEASMLQ